MSLSITLSVAQGCLLFIAISFPLLLLAYVVHRLRNMRYYELASTFPGPNASPFIGHLKTFYKSPEAILKLAYPPGSSNKAVKLWKCHKLHVFISHPDDIESVLKSHKNINKPSEFDYFNPCFRYSLYLRNDIKWGIYKKYVQKHFSMDVMNLFVGCINHHTSDLLNELKATGGQQVEAFDFVGNAVLNVLYEMVLGVEANPDNIKTYGKNMRRLHALVQKRMHRPMVQFNLLYYLTSDGREEKQIIKAINDTTMKVYYERNSYFKERGDTLKGLVGFKSYEDENGFEARVFEEFEYSKKKENLALIDLFIDDCEFGVVFTHEEIMMKTNSLLHQGYETTTLVVCYFLNIMATHPEIQEKCHEELHTIFGTSNRTATMADTKKMEYLERCIMETLRLFGPYSFIQRTLSEEVELGSSRLTVPVGATIVICCSQLHRDENLYESPNTFNPDNFLYENLKNRHLYSYIPFAAGPRSCAGLNAAMLMLKLTISSIMREFTIRSSEPMEKWHTPYQNFLHKVGGFKLAFLPRQ